MQCCFTCRSVARSVFRRATCTFVCCIPKNCAQDTQHASYWRILVRLSLGDSETPDSGARCHSLRLALIRLLPLIRLWHSGSDSCTTAVHHKGIYPFVRLCTTATLAVTGSVQVMKQRGPVLSGSPLGGDVMRQWSTGALSLEQGASFLGASNSGSHWQHCVK